MHTGLWHLHCQQESDPSISKANPFLDGYKPVLPELKTIAKTKYSVAKIAIPDSSSDTLLSL